MLRSSTQTSTSRATVDDTNTGNSSIASATYRIKGYSDGSDYGSGAMLATDGAFDSPVEAVSQTITGGLGVGEYNICVSGTDGEGNEGEESCSRFVTYDPISVSALNLEIPNECAQFYTLENEGAENEITTLQYGENIIFDTDFKVNLGLNFSDSGKVNLNFHTMAKGAGHGVTSGIQYQFILNSMLRAKTALSDFDPSRFTFDVKAKIVGQPQEIDGYGILNGAQNNAELLFKVRLDYANGHVSHKPYDFSVSCAGDPWVNLMENKDADTKQPVGPGWGDEEQKYAWAGEEFNGSLIVGTKSAWYDILAYSSGDDGGPISTCQDNPPAGLPSTYWNFACLELVGDESVRTSTGAQIWNLSHKNKRWRKAFDAGDNKAAGEEYVQGFRKAVVHNGKLYIAGDYGAFVSGVSYVNPGIYPSVGLFESEDGITFNKLNCPTGMGDLCHSSYNPTEVINSIRAMTSLNGKLWIGSIGRGGEIWLYDDETKSFANLEPGSSFALEGIGNGQGAGELQPYGDYLYATLGGSIWDDYPNNDYLHRCPINDCDQYSDFVPVPDLPDLDPTNMFILKLFVAQGKLFLGTVNFTNGFSFVSYDKAENAWDVIVDGPYSGGMFDAENVYLWSSAVINNRIFIGTFNPATMTEIPRGTAELWYSDDGGVTWFQYPMPLEWPLQQYGIRNMVECDGGKYLCLLGASNMLGPRVDEPNSPLRSGATVWRIHKNKVVSPSSKGKDK